MAGFGFNPSGASSSGLPTLLNASFATLILPASTRENRFTAPAANEGGAIVVADLFRLDVTGEVMPPGRNRGNPLDRPGSLGAIEFAPLIRDQVLPALLSV